MQTRANAEIDVYSEFGNQVIRDTKYKTTGRRVVKEIQGQIQNQNAEKQTRARQIRSQKQRVSYTI